MKKSLLTLVSLVAVGGGINAQTTTPSFYSENFIEMGREHNYVTDGWTTYGVDAKVVDILESFYPENDPDLNPYMILNYGNLSIPMACTNFTPPTEADQWLISPIISVPQNADNAVLNFTVC
ncbi:MAG: hypothetical protein K2M03_05520, partial [Muribaculaceae bacterium]|nr:hypothetical protein [Muribaculaceae bacterium]